MRWSSCVQAHAFKLMRSNSCVQTHAFKLVSSSACIDHLQFVQTSKRPDLRDRGASFMAVANLRVKPGARARGKSLANCK